MENFSGENVEPVESEPVRVEFQETPTMVAAKAKLIEAVKSGDVAAMQENGSAYSIEADAIITAAPMKDQPRLNFEFQMQLAEVSRAAGNQADYLDSLLDAATYAQGEGLVEEKVRAQRLIAELP
jgi:hypothetical protein